MDFASILNVFKIVEKVKYFRIGYFILIYLIVDFSKLVLDINFIGFK